MIKLNKENLTRLKFLDGALLQFRPLYCYNQNV